MTDTVAITYPTRSRRRPRCNGCGSSSITKQCDHPVAHLGGRPCGAYLCDGCAVAAGVRGRLRNVDLCPEHASASRAAVLASIAAERPVRHV